MENFLQKEDGTREGHSVKESGEARARESAWGARTRARGGCSGGIKEDEFQASEEGALRGLLCMDGRVERARFCDPVQKTRNLQEMHGKITTIFLEIPAKTEKKYQIPIDKTPFE